MKTNHTYTLIIVHHFKFPNIIALYECGLHRYAYMTIRSVISILHPVLQLAIYNDYNSHVTLALH